MKTFTTLTAVAALIAGMSIASAQTMAPQSGSKGSAKQFAGVAQYCIETSPGGGFNCTYTNLAACEKDAKPNDLQCERNPNFGTTGTK